MSLGFTSSQHRKLGASYGREFAARAKKAKAAAAAGRCGKAETELLAVAAWHGAKAAERTGAGAGPQRVTGGKALAPVIKAVRKHCRCVKRKQKA
jgi:hypothetical protein